MTGWLFVLALGAMPGISQANTLYYTFNGSDSGGTGSATMLIEISGNTMTIKLDNTSPLALTNNTGINSPGITGFGFNLTDPLPKLSSWSLTAKKTDGSGPFTIGSSELGSTGAWILNTTIAGVTLDFLPTTSYGINQALYNPDSIGPFSGKAPYYETRAVMKMTFDSAPVLALGACGNGISVSPTGQCETFVRMQNVGTGGSLKIPGIDPPPPGESLSVAEPNSLTLLGLGLIASASTLRRRKLQS